MKDGGSFEQCYNAQAAVEVETMLIVGKRVSDAPNDKEQMQPTLAVVSPVAGAVGAVLIDSGYYSEKAVTSVEDGGHGPKVYAAVKRQGHSRSVSQLEERPDPPRSAPIRPDPPRSAAWSESGRDHGAPAGDKGGRGTLQTAKTNRRTSLRHHQGSARVPALPAAWSGESESGMDTGEQQIQSQTSLQPRNDDQGRVRSPCGGSFYPPQRFKRAEAASPSPITCRAYTRSLIDLRKLPRNADRSAKHWTQVRRAAMGCGPFLTSARDG